MSELRKDPVIDRWVVIARERGRRPVNYKTSIIPLSDLPCPFCPGNENQTPPEIERTQTSKGNWLTRVIPNKYPAVSADVPECGEQPDLFTCIKGLGRHEVVIETGEHNCRMAHFSDSQLELILKSYRSRCLELSKDAEISYMIIFKNEGIRAGATIDHPHTQLIALPVIPQNIEEELKASDRYYQSQDRCIYCAIIDEELQLSKRLIAENDRFIAISAYAARFPYETWILPKLHKARFEHISDIEIKQLAGILKSILFKMGTLIDDFSFNYMIHSSPFHIKTEDFFHWHLEILPRTTNIAGFEWGTGYYINPVPPEEAAQRMKDVIDHC